MRCEKKEKIIRSPNSAAPVAICNVVKKGTIGSIPRAPALRGQLTRRRRQKERQRVNAINSNEQLWTSEQTYR